MMIKPYEVTIHRTIITTIKVDAYDTQDANDKIMNYGIVEAANDFDQVHEVMLSKIVKVKLIRRRK